MKTENNKGIQSVKIPVSVTYGAVGYPIASPNTFRYRHQSKLNMISFEFYNSYTNEYLGGAHFHYDRMKALRNYYSRYFKRMKTLLAEEFRLDKHWVHANILFYNNHQLFNISK